jgi:hypothetical protein
VRGIGEGSEGARALSPRAILHQAKSCTAKTGFYPAHEGDQRVGDTPEDGDGRKSIERDPCQLHVSSGGHITVKCAVAERWITVRAYARQVALINGIKEQVQGVLRCRDGHSVHDRAEPPHRP